jgi:hypothetical protein
MRWLRSKKAARCRESTARRTLHAGAGCDHAGAASGSIESHESVESKSIEWPCIVLRPSGRKQRAWPGAAFARGQRPSADVELPAPTGCCTGNARRSTSQNGTVSRLRDQRSFARSIICLALTSSLHTEIHSFSHQIGRKSSSCNYENMNLFGKAKATAAHVACVRSVRARMSHTNTHTRRRSACVLRVRILHSNPPPASGGIDCMVPRSRDFSIPVWAHRCDPLPALGGQGPRTACCMPQRALSVLPGCTPRRRRRPPGQRRDILRQGHGHPLQQARDNKTKTSLGMSKAAASQPPFANWTWAQTTGYLRPSHRGFPPKTRRAAAGSAVGPALLGGHKEGVIWTAGKKRGCCLDDLDLHGEKKKGDAN